MTDVTRTEYYMGESWHPINAHGRIVLTHKCGSHFEVRLTEEGDLQIKVGHQPFKIVSGFYQERGMLLIKRPGEKT